MHISYPLKTKYINSKIYSPILEFVIKLQIADPEACIWSVRALTHQFIALNSRTRSSNCVNSTLYRNGQRSYSCLQTLILIHAYSYVYIMHSIQHSDRGRTECPSQSHWLHESESTHFFRFQKGRAQGGWPRLQHTTFESATSLAEPIGYQQPVDAFFRWDFKLNSAFSCFDAV